MEEGEFSDWYVREHRRVVASLAALSGNADAARDAADEAFVRALVHWKRVRTMDTEPTISVPASRRSEPIAVPGMHLHTHAMQMSAKGPR